MSRSKPSAPTPSQVADARWSAACAQPQALPPAHEECKGPNVERAKLQDASRRKGPFKPAISPSAMDRARTGFGLPFAAGSMTYIASPPSRPCAPSSLLLHLAFSAFPELHPIGLTTPR